MEWFSIQPIAGTVEGDQVKLRSAARQPGFQARYGPALPAGVTDGRQVTRGRIPLALFQVQPGDAVANGVPHGRWRVAAQQVLEGRHGHARPL